MNQEILPIWKTNASIGKSIITYEDELEIREDSPVSIFAIAKKYNLSQLTIIDSSFLAFPNLYKACKKYDIHLIYGIEFTVCNDVKDKSEKSLSNTCKISVLMKNSEGYRDLIKLHDKMNANAENFYYEPRGDYSILKDNFTDNLELLIQPYNNFLEKNLIYNGDCLPNWGNIKPIMTFANQELPYDKILNWSIHNYAKNNNYQCIESHPIYYFKDEDIKPYMVYRSIINRGKFAKPNINYLCSEAFSLQSYRRKMNLND